MQPITSMQEVCQNFAGFANSNEYANTMQNKQNHAALLGSPLPDLKARTLRHELKSLRDMQRSARLGVPAPTSGTCWILQTGDRNKDQTLTQHAINYSDPSGKRIHANPAALADSGPATRPHPWLGSSHRGRTGTHGGVTEAVWPYCGCTKPVYVFDAWSMVTWWLSAGNAV